MIPIKMVYNHVKSTHKPSAITLIAKYMLKSVEYHSRVFYGSIIIQFIEIIIVPIPCITILNK